MKTRITNYSKKPLVQEFPNDMLIHALHALNLGLCLKVDRGDLTAGQASELFNKMRNTINKEITDKKNKF